MTKKVLVTGGAGFIGSAVVERLLRTEEFAIVNVDKLTYAAGSDGSPPCQLDHRTRYHFEHVDICDGHAIRRVLHEQQPDAIMHLAAESHVDRSIDGPADFVQTNIVGTFTLLQAALDYWCGLAPSKRDAFRFHSISTDEVFGSLGEAGIFTEESNYQPHSPYAASKAASDHLARAWHHTFGLPVLVTNCSNNYGPYQFPEKLIPLATIRGLTGQSIPVYGRGENVRDWIYVYDHADALLTIIQRGRVGETYNVGGGSEMRNIDVVRMICEQLDELAPDSPYRPHSDLITFVADRPGHDFRYAMDFSKLRTELGWEPRETFASGLRKTVEWYIQHRDWWEAILRRGYGGERLGLCRFDGGQARSEPA